MRILHLASFLQGGAGRVITDLAIAQQQAGHDVAMVTSRTGVPEMGYANSRDCLDDLARARIQVDLVDSMFVRDHAANLAVVRAVLDRFPPGQVPDVLHTHAAVPSLVALLVAGAVRAPLVVLQTMHGWSAAKTPGQVATDVALMNLVDGVAVPSQHAAAVLTSLGIGPHRMAVVPYGVGAGGGAPDVHDRTALAEMARARQAGLLVAVSVAGPGPRRHQRVLVDAVARMQGPRAVHALFVGDGDASELAQAIDAAGLRGRLRVHAPTRAARALVAAADVLVLPARSEAQPLALLEAFHDGTIPIVSNIPELTELVTDGATGLTFAVDDATALAGALDRVAGLSEAARHALAGRARLIQAARFTTAVMADSYLDLYRTSARRRDPGPRPVVTPAA